MTNSRIDSNRNWSRPGIPDSLRCVTQRFPPPPSKDLPYVVIPEHCRVSFTCPPPALAPVIDAIALAIIIGLPLFGFESLAGTFAESRQYQPEGGLLLDLV